VNSSKVIALQATSAQQPQSQLDKFQHQPAATCCQLD
jgi:hypothetical protein